MPDTAQQPAANPLSDDELGRIDAWWRAANYLSVGQIYLLDNLSLSETLYAWRAGANWVMLIPNGRCSGAAVGCANQFVSLKSKA